MENLRTGEKIAAASGIALLLIMFILDWFSVEAAGGFGGISIGGNAWDTMEVIRWILLLTGLAALALAAISATRTRLDLPVALSAIVAGLGVLSTLLVLFRIISPPDGGAGDLIDVGRDIGVFLGLLAAAGVAYGGWKAMQEEGTTFGDQADRFRGPGDGGTGTTGTEPRTGTGTAAPPAGGTAPPPPPPPSGSPPPDRPGGPAA